MPNKPIPNKISGKITRIIFLRVLPGQEQLVIETLINRCNDANVPIRSRKFYRIFGAYDILVIITSPELSSHPFISIGAIPEITGSSEHICYSWSHSNQEEKNNFDFKLSELTGNIVGLAFVKINPELSRNFGNVSERTFFNYYLSEMPNYKLLGTLGTNEAVILTSGNSLNSILEGLIVHNSRLLYNYSLNRKSPFVVEKTSSIIGFRSHLSTKNPKRSQKVGLSKAAKRNLKVTLSVSCKPQVMKRVANLIESTFKTQSDGFILGPRDLFFNISLDRYIHLNKFIFDLDKLKIEFPKILRTKIELGYKHIPNITSSEKLNAYKSKVVALSVQETKSICKLGTIGETVSQLIYQYNNLSQNELLRDAYEDMLSPMIALKYLSLGLAEESCSEQKSLQLKVISRRLSHLDIGLRQRGQSLFMGLDSGPFISFPSGEGMQKVLIALESMVKSTLASYDIAWNGFAQFSFIQSKLEHYADILLAPVDVVVSCKDYWAVCHETMHIFQNCHEDKFEPDSYSHYDSQGKKDSRAIFSHGTEAYDTFHELVTDVLDYALCCPLDLETYSIVVWRYLERHLLIDDFHQASNYLQRTFGVVAYEYLKNKANIFQVLSNPSELRDRLIGIAEVINTNCGSRVLDKIDPANQSLIEVTLDRFLYFIVFSMPDLVTQVKELEPEFLKSAKHKRKLKTSIGKIQNGKILSIDEIDYPASLFWALSQLDENYTAQSTLATISSMWNHFLLSSN